MVLEQVAAARAGAFPERAQDRVDHVGVLLGPQELLGRCGHRAEDGVAAQQRFFRAPLGARVLHLSDPPAQPPVGVPDPGDAHQRPDRLPVLGDVPFHELEAVGLTRFETLMLPVAGVEILGVRDVGVRTPHELLGLVAEQGREGAVDAQEPPVGRRQDHSDRRGVESTQKQILARLRLRLERVNSHVVTVIGTLVGSRKP